MLDPRRLALPVALAAMATSAVLATPPKPGIQGGPGIATDEPGKGRQAGPDGVEVRNAMALRGGVGEDAWLEALHRLTRVPSPRREAVTRAVRAYIVEAAAWRETKAPTLKTLTSELIAIRESGEAVPRDLTRKVREIRQSMPRLSDLQSAVWDILNSPEQSRLVDEVTELKRTGLPKDIVDGRRAPGTPARVTVKTPADGETAPAEPTDGEAAPPPAPALWSFVDDPNAGKPLPDPPAEGDASTTTPKSGESR